MAVIVTISTPTDPSRMLKIYKPLVGFQIPGTDTAVAELTLEQLHGAIEQLNTNFVGTVNWRVVECVNRGSVSLAFGYVREYDTPVETMEILFEEEDRDCVRETLSQIALLENVEAFSA
jgi:hypothetical protein